jgi:hypothetical protein
MTASDAYGGCFYALRQARNATTPEEALGWLHGAMQWREIARALRRMRRAA